MVSLTSKDTPIAYNILLPQRSLARGLVIGGNTEAMRVLTCRQNLGIDWEFSPDELILRRKKLLTFIECLRHASYCAKWLTLIFFI